MKNIRRADRRKSSPVSLSPLDRHQQKTLINRLCCKFLTTWWKSQKVSLTLPHPTKYITTALHIFFLHLIFFFVDTLLLGLFVFFSFRFESRVIFHLFLIGQVFHRYYRIADFFSSFYFWVPNQWRCWDLSYLITSYFRPLTNTPVVYHPQR